MGIVVLVEGGGSQVNKVGWLHVAGHCWCDRLVENIW